jgi:hypothetical protein
MTLRSGYSCGVNKWGVSSTWRTALAACASAFLLLAFASTAAAKTNKTGYDISYPQCGGAYPSGQAFGIVGVNGGLANDANGCLKSEIAWAQASPGLSLPSQAPASLYINTADPGPAPGVTDWPSSGSSDQYGSCNGDWSKACAYLYGQQRATYSYGLVNAIDSNLASTAPWWLDIETSNSWATSSTSGYKGLNIAAIQGFISGLESAGAAAPVGVYSTGGQWNTITGLTAQTTAAALRSSPPAWTAGARTLKQAQNKCAATAFTGVRPTLAQYSANGYDADLRCG